MTREAINNYQGENNVTKITGDNGSISYLTASTSFHDEAFRVGACKLNTVETATKHVLFLFNEANAEVGRYYLGKKLQGMKPDELAAKVSTLCIFKSWNPTANGGNGSWVPCVGLSTQEDLSAKAVSF